MIKRTLIPTILICACTQAIADGSWINLNDGALKASLQSSIDTLKAQTAQIHTNKATNQQQEIDIGHNLDLINGLRLDVNNEFATLRGEVSNQFGSLRSEVDNQFNAVDGQLQDVDGDIAEHFGYITNLNSQAISINGFDSIASTTRSGSTLSDNVAQLQTSLANGEDILALHTAQIAAGESTLQNHQTQIANGAATLNQHTSQLADGTRQLSNLYGQVASKASLADVRSSVRVGISSSQSCAEYITSYTDSGRIEYHGCKRYVTNYTGAYLY